MNRSVLRVVTLCAVSLSLGAGAITMTTTAAYGQGANTQGQPAVSQNPATGPQFAAPRSPDIMHDPILMRNCQAEYDHAAAGFGAASPQDLYTAAAIDTKRGVSTKNRMQDRSGGPQARLPHEHQWGEALDHRA
jgi:hypothetical protein